MSLLKIQELIIVYEIINLTVFITFSGKLLPPQYRILPNANWDHKSPFTAWSFTAEVRTSLSAAPTCKLALSLAANGPEIFRFLGPTPDRVETFDKSAQKLCFNVNSYLYSN